MVYTKMKIKKARKAMIGTLLIVALFVSCKNDTSNQVPDNSTEKTKTDMKKISNPVVYFEIPVTDMDRAVQFYSAVFNFEFKKDVIDHNEMALFPFVDATGGISGALAKGEIYKPTINGVLIYFTTEDIDRTLRLAVENGGEVLYPKTSNGALGFVAEFKDCEDNRIALHMDAE